MVGFFPYSFADYLRLKSILFASQLLQSQLEAGLENSFLNDPSTPETVVALATNFTVVGTPGSDAVVFTGTSGSDIFISREGNDVLIAVNPGSPNPGKGEIDFLSGSTGKDRFILGDWNKVYYENDGTKGLASILDFDSNEDVIQLHGIASDYRLVDFSQLNLTGLGTAIFHNGSALDVIAILPGVSNLNLNKNYFKFEGYTPPAEVAFKEIKQFGTSGLDASSRISANNFGDVYLTGWTTGSLEGLNAGEDDAWVAKYDSNGNQQWIRQFGTSKRDESYDVATDKFGNVYLTGVTFGSLAGSNAGIERDAWVAKYDSNGNQLWVRQFGTFALEINYGIAVDDSGNAYITGYTRGSLGGQNIGKTDDWITKFDTNGNQQWVKQFGTTGYDESFDSAVDSNGNSYTTGWVQSTSGTLTPSSYNASLSKFDTNGNQQWTQQFGSSDFDWSWSVAADSNDNVFTAGLTLGNLGGVNAGSYDAWLAKYDSNGNQQWIQQFGTTGDDAAFSAATDKFGNVYLTGTTDGNLGGVNAGSDDAWVAKYDSSGNQQWIQQFGTSALDKAYGITINNADEVYITGITEGSLGATNVGSYDAWVAKLSATNGSLLNFSPSSGTSASLTSDLVGSPSPLATDNNLLTAALSAVLPNY